ncbi:hypothetical protein AZI86_18460 [Bdellovibrio bacteriovorus]|uniref:Uncharacterized protein n=1 Tax=Bdellovibrio bacteriovorus TaxID=959 RepID=A0A150WEX0_BDEBC|nr:hypothetical protein [Bdellovibrio bacteriovorus]KYG61678.1 hypothetical protein AZI86_18460 [Bdellovibrio bacteriovorus]
MKLFLASFLFLSPVFAQATTVECYCYYLAGRPAYWEWVDIIRFDADRSNYEARGEKTCKRRADAVILDKNWNGEVKATGCRFVN